MSLHPKILLSAFSAFEQTGLCIVSERLDGESEKLTGTEGGIAIERERERENEGGRESKGD